MQDVPQCHSEPPFLKNQNVHVDPRLDNDFRSMLQQDKLHPVRSATTSQVGSVSPFALPSSHQKGQAQQGRPQKHPKWGDGVGRGEPQRE